MSEKEIIAALGKTCNIIYGHDTQFHMAVVDPHTGYLITKGSKTIESRLSKVRQNPHERVNAGDVVLIKTAGGPIIGAVRVSRAIYFTNLNEEDIHELKEKYNDCIQANDAYWNRKMSSRYGTLLFLTDNCVSERPLHVNKSDRRPWITFNEKNMSMIMIGRK